MDKPRLLVTTLVAALLASVAVSAAAPGFPTVATDNGPIRGLAIDGIEVFRGIPYAAPPVGDLRWRPPQEPARWNGVLDATRFANHCPQGPSPYGIASLTEDCLYLNVFTPSKTNHGLLWSMASAASSWRRFASPLRAMVARILNCVTRRPLGRIISSYN